MKQFNCSMAKKIESLAKGGKSEAKKSEDFDMNQAFFQAKKAITDWTKRQGHKTLEWLYTDGRKSPTSYPSGIWDFEWDTGNGMATAELKVSPYETRTNSWNDSMDFSLRVGTEDKPTFYTSVEDVLSALDTLISETEESKKSEGEDDKGCEGKDCKDDTTKKNEADATFKVGDFVSYEAGKDGKDPYDAYVHCEVISINDDGTLDLCPFGTDAETDGIGDNANPAYCEKLDHFAGMVDANHYYMDGKYNAYKGGWEILITDKELNPKVYEFIGTIDDLSEVIDIDDYYGGENFVFDEDLKDEVENNTGWDVETTTFADMTGDVGESKQTEGLPPKKLGNRMYRSRADLINKMKTLDAVEITTPAQFNDIHSKQWLHTAGYAMDINGNLVGQTYFGDKDGKWYYATTKTFQGDYLPECKEEAKKGESMERCDSCGAIMTEYEYDRYGGLCKRCRERDESKKSESDTTDAEQVFKDMADSLGISDRSVITTDGDRVKFVLKLKLKDLEDYAWEYNPELKVVKNIASPTADAFDGARKTVNTVEDAAAWLKGGIEELLNMEKEAIDLVGNESKKSEAYNWIAFYFCKDKRTGTEYAVIPQDRVFVVGNGGGRYNLSYLDANGHWDRLSYGYFATSCEPISDPENSKVYAAVKADEDRRIIALTESEFDTIVEADDAVKTVKSIVANNYESKKSEDFKNFTLKQLRFQLKNGWAKDLTNASDEEIQAIIDSGHSIGGVSNGTYGMNGLLVNYTNPDGSLGSGVVIGRTPNLFALLSPQKPKKTGDAPKQTERRLNPVSVDAITKDDFDAYVAVQRSGKYNMIMDADAAADDADLDIDTYYGIIKNYGALVSKYGRKGKSLSESLTLKQKELKNMARYGEATDITTISDAEAKELKKKGIETVGISRGAYGMNGALLRDNEGNKYVITARSSNLFYFV